tara:strand:+ start:1319 stop:2881 length:1563 start_codon:yes stop_codon:yes gene_type:complete
MADKTMTFEIDSNIKSVTKDVDKLDKSTDKASGGFKKMGTAVKGIGTALKAAGIGLVVALLAKLGEVFSKNQKVLDTFNTAMVALEIAFNDLFTFISNNIGAVTGFFKDIFENPQESLKDFADAIKDNLIERFQSLLDMIGHLGKAINHLFKGEFAEAKDAAVNAGKEMVDTFTGVDNSVDKITETVKKASVAVLDYSKNTLDQAKSIVAVTKAAELASVEFARLNAQFLKDAEIQRQIRDDETKTFAERIAANLELDKILAEQQKAQKAQIQLQINAAQAQFSLNSSQENLIALKEQEVALLELEETITGQLSEQKTNQVGLEKELLETQNELRAEGLKGIDRELEELENSYKLKLDMARKSGVDITAITEQYERQKTLLIAENTSNQLAAYSELAGALGALAGDNKELAIAQAVMDTYAGANKAFAEGGTLGFVTGAAIIAQGLANVQSIMNTKVPGGGGGGGSAPSVGSAQPAPQMMSGSFELSNTAPPEPMQAYVVSDDITNNQDKLAAIRRRATI